MKAADRNCRPGAMRSVAVIVGLSTALFAAPAHASGPSVAATAGVEAMNRDGLAEFAPFDPDVSSLIVSPVLTWYVRRFLTLHSHDAQAATFVEQLRRSGVAIDATVHAARGRSDYTERIASLEREDLGVKTLWDQPQGPTDYAWTFSTEMRFRDGLNDERPVDSGNPQLRAPFYARDGIRAVRLEAADGARALFVFWGAQAVLTDLRRRMSANVWRTMSQGFTEAELSISNLALYRRGAVAVPLRADEDSARSPFPRQRAPTSSSTAP